MIPKIDVKCTCLSVLASVLLGAPAWAQEAPGLLKVSTLMAEALKSHPHIRAAEFQIEARKKDLSASQRLRWPELSLAYESDENKKLTGSASRLVRAQQNLWDFGRVGALVRESDTQIQLSELQLEIQKQELGYQVVQAWQLLFTAHFKLEAAQWAESEMATLEAQMRRRVEVGASPKIDLELVNSRLLQARVDKAAMQAQRATALGQLHLLSAIPGLQEFDGPLERPPTGPRLRAFAAEVQALPVANIAAEHDAVRRADLSQQAMAHQLKAKSTEQYGQLYFRADFPLDKTSVNTNKTPTWFVGLSYAPGAGFSSVAQTQALAIRVEAAGQDVAVARLDAERQIQADQQEFLSSHARVEALGLSVKGAERVLDSYQQQFVAGRKSWLDLLNTVRELTQTQFQLIDAEGALVGAMERLRLRAKNADVLKMAPT